jgi:hypothetical protein
MTDHREIVGPDGSQSPFDGARGLGMEASFRMNVSIIEDRIEANDNHCV